MNGKHILVAEDDPQDARMTLAALEDERIPNEVIVVHDGEELLDYLFCRERFETRKGGNPVAILLDLKMPKIDGLEALKIIKADEHLRTIPVVMLTSSREPADLNQCYALGVNGYVVKPVDFVDFAQAVRKLGAYWAAVNEPPPERKESASSLQEAAEGSPQ